MKILQEIMTKYIMTQKLTYKDTAYLKVIKHYNKDYIYKIGHFILNIIIEKVLSI